MTADPDSSGARRRNGGIAGRGQRREDVSPAAGRALIQVVDRHLLAWAHSDLVGSNNDDQTIRKMLRLNVARTGGGTR
jgi:hypothetical protein